MQVEKKRGGRRGEERGKDDKKEKRDNLMSGWLCGCERCAQHIHQSRECMRAPFGFVRFDLVKGRKEEEKKEENGEEENSDKKKGRLYGAHVAGGH